MRACGGGDANHYLFVAQTNSGMWCKPIVVRASTNTGRPADLYRSLYLPKEGAVAQAAEAVRRGVKQCPSKQLCKTR